MTPVKRSNAMRVFMRNKTAFASLIFLVIVIAACIAAPLLTTYSPFDQFREAHLSPPSSSHILGGDYLGRDMFSRMLYGGRTTIGMSVASIAITAVVGCLIGMASGYFGGKLDNAIMRVMDVISAIPSILLAIAVVAFLGIGAVNSMIAIAVAAIPPFVRLVRTAVQNVLESPYITAARALGAGHIRIIVVHVLHNIFAPVVVHLTTGVADAILVFSSLGYLKLAVQPPNPEWGNMVIVGMANFRSALFLLVEPCAAIGLTILAFNLLGDGLRDVLDPMSAKE